MITNLEKNLYNTYLRVSRTAENKPFTFRKDFSDMDPSIIVHLNRISNLFLKYPHINPEDYFISPYKIYPNAEHFTLEYYAGMGAVKSYSLYKKQIQELPPDSPEQIDFIIKSLKYIGAFCIKHGIKIDQYPKFKIGLTYEWMKQVKKHEISIYVLMEFSEINNIIEEVPEDERELFLGDLGKYYLGYKSKYIQSKMAKQLVKEGINKIIKIISEK
ncbi:MAG: hypothetical protein PHS54_00485 [Clostridia bacterium]|nr:hypothetical protein [Clostridia bacterium]